MNRTLIIFAKSPVVGRVKTRLCPPLTPPLAAGLARAFVADTVAKALRVVQIPMLCFDGEKAVLEAALLAEGLPSESVVWTSQGPGDLGERLARVPPPCVIIGTDSPNLPLTYLQEAFLIVESGRVVIGPSADGGYFLIGLPTSLPALFAGIEWSTDLVLTQTLANAARAGVSPVLLPVWYDIDTETDLRRLDLDLISTVGIVPDECPATRRLWPSIRPSLFDCV